MKMQSSNLVTVSAHHHHDTLLDSLWKSVQNRELVDFGLAVNCQLLWAHQLVLGAFFPPVYLQNIGPKHWHDSILECLIEFVYRGTVSLPVEQLDTMLELARRLKFTMLVDALITTKNSVQLVNTASTHQQGGRVEETGSCETIVALLKQPTMSNVCVNANVFKPPNNEIILEVDGNTESDPDLNSNNGDEVCDKIHRNNTMYISVAAYNLPQNVDEGLLHDWTNSESQPDMTSPESVCAKNDANSSVDGEVRWNEFEHDNDQVGSEDNRGKVNTNSERQANNVNYCPSHVDKLHNNLENKTRRESDQELKNIAEQLPNNSNIARMNEHADVSSDRTSTDKKAYKCQFCSKVFKQSGHLKEHVMIHTGEKPFKCEVCPKAFSRPGGLKSHMQDHVDDVPFICKICSKVFSDVQSLKAHSLVHAHTGTSDYRFKCPVCSTVFKRIGHLTEHMRIHTGEKPFKCEVCSKAFSRPSGLKSHMQDHVDDVPFICKVCFKVFSDVQSLEVHSLIHNPGQQDDSTTNDSAPFEISNNRLKCTVCSKVFKRIGHLTEHMRIHTGEKPFKCEVCSKAFSRLGGLKSHMQDHTSGRPFLHKVCSKDFSDFQSVAVHSWVPNPGQQHQPNTYENAHIETSGNRFECQLCSKGFQRSGQFANHMRRHADEKPFMCEVCSKTFKIKSLLTYHMHTHTGDGKHKCHLCSKAFNRRSQLTKHIQTHTSDVFQCEVCLQIFSTAFGLKVHSRSHNPPDQQYKCTACPKAYSHKRLLAAHARIHTGHNPFKCKVCSMQFTCSTHLMIHNRTHTGEKPYKCNLCTKAFNQANSLTVHIRTHTGEKPYKCDICSMAFNTSSKRIAHTRTHTGERPYKCEMCSKAFKHSETLKAHVRSHTGDKPYKCKVCLRAFNKSSHRRVHMRIHTGERPYKCKVCLTEFKYLVTLKYHMKTHAN